LRFFSISGFDYIGSYARSAGTSPGIWLGIVVPYTVQEVKAKLRNLDSQKINIEKVDIDESTDDIGLKGKTHVRTQIACIGW
jgi:hypothetical protein